MYRRDGQFWNHVMRELQELATILRMAREEKTP